MVNNFPLIPPGKYTWRSADADFPITVIYNLGPGPDGCLYVKIEESRAAVPVDEIVGSGRIVRQQWMEIMGLSQEEIDRNCPPDEFFDYHKELIEYNAIIDVRRMNSRKPSPKRIFE